MALRSVFFEQRIDLLDCQLLQDELIHLQRDAISGKVDHPVGGCFTGDTKIRLTDGSSITILELLHNNSYNCEVFTVNEATLEIEPKRIKRVFKTKDTDELLKVYLSNTECVTCTPDHRFMLANGMYIEACKLSLGMELMSSDTKVYVLTTKRIQSMQAVYDLTIEDNPNFMLDAGVVVHNSKDIADSLAGAVWKAITDNPAIQAPISNTVNVITSVNGGRGNYGSMNNRYRGRSSGKSSIFPTLR